MDKIKQVLNTPLGRRKNGVSTRKVFGISLETLMQLQAKQSNEGSGYRSTPNVPFVVDRICRHIFANGIEEEGIFRVNGNARVMEKLRDNFEKHGDADLESAEDIFAVAGLLKQFLRDLPEAVIPEEFTNRFVKCQEATKSDKGQFIEKLTALLQLLPKSHYDLLKYLTRFLVDVAAKDSNRMSPMGLAIVFGPNLFRCSAGIEGLRDQGVINEIVCKFIVDYPSLFGELTEPGPFTIPHIHQDREKRKQAPLRPPPPKFTDNNPTLTLPTEYAEDLRPTTSLSQEFMERASPFTIVDGDGHSSIASPVLSAVASELVTKTISEAVLEHIFSEKEVRSIFDHWGDTDDSSTRNSTPHSSIQHHRRHTPLVSNDNVDSTLSRQSTSMSASTPQPRPRTTPSSEETKPGPQPKPRSHKHSMRSPDVPNTEDVALSEHKDVEIPKPKPRTKSAPARHGSLGDVLHHSIDMPVVASKPEVSADSVQNTKSSGSDSVFDDITVSVMKLEHFKKPKGPVKKVSRKQKGTNSPGSTSDEGKRRQPPTISVSDVNNNNNENHASPSSDLPVVNGPPTIVVVHKPSDEETTPPLVTNGIHEVASSGDTLDARAGENMLAASPHGNAVEGLTPEPKRQHRNTVEDEQRAAQIKSLNKKINALKKKVRSFEEAFEAEHGHKPSTHEKNAKMDMKKTLIELSKCRKDLKHVGGEEEQDVKEQNSSRVDSAEPNNEPINEQDGRSESVVNMATSSEPPTMADTLELLLKKLKDKRLEANRPDDINTFTRDQVQEEKLAVQKALLHFESIHGRPQTKSEKELMRPLYDRYRQIKKVLATAPVSKSEKKQTNQVPSAEAAAAEADATEMMVTQHPDVNQHVAGGDEEEREETPAEERGDRETNLQDLSLPELKSELEKANNIKKKLRKLLRDFEDDFQKENGRKVQKEDRGPMDSKYQEYKQIKAKIKLLEALLSKHDTS